MVSISRTSCFRVETHIVVSRAVSVKLIPRHPIYMYNEVFYCVIRIRVSYIAENAANVPRACWSGCDALMEQLKLKKKKSRRLSIDIKKILGFGLVTRH